MLNSTVEATRDPFVSNEAPSVSEKLTVVERVVAAFHLPFPLACAALALLIGFPANLAAAYLDTGDLGRASNIALTNNSFGTVQLAGESPAISVARSVIFTVFLFTAIYTTRYFRRKVASSRGELSEIMPGGEKGFDEVFGAVSGFRGVLVVAVILGVAYVVPRVLSSVGPFMLLYSVSGTVLEALIISTVVWEYLYGLWGLRRLGSTNLSLKPYYTDRMLGLRPMGSISISFGVAFFAMVGMALIGGVLSNDPANMGVTIGLLSLAVVMQFLPLEGIHRKMAERKRAELEALQARTAEALRSGDSEGHDAESRLEVIGKLIRVRMEREELTAMPTWPFDTKVVERLTAIMIAVITVVLARMTQLALGL